MGHWQLNSRISSIIAIADRDETDDVIYTLRKTNRCLIERHTPGKGKEQEELKSQRLLDVARPLQMIQILAMGNVILAVYSGGLYIGEMLKQGSTSAEDLIYTWREVSCVEPVTCFHARYRPNEPTVPAKKEKKKKKERKASKRDVTGALDVAIGGVRGTIIILRDFLAKLKAEEMGSNGLPVSSDLLAPRILHWHREAVGSLKWSRDGVLRFSTYDHW